MNLHDVIESNEKPVEKKDIPIEVENISVENFMDIINLKRKITNLVSKINKALKGKAKIDINKIWKWVKNRKANASKEEVSVEGFLGGSDLLLFNVIISGLVLIWITIRNQKKRESTYDKLERFYGNRMLSMEELYGDRVYNIRELSNGYKADREVSVVNKKDIDKYIKLCEDMVKYTNNLLGPQVGNKFDDIKIDKPPKEYVERKYKKYLKEFQFFIEKQNPTFTGFQKEHTIFHLAVSRYYTADRLNVSHETLKDHGYKESDFEKYKKEWYRILDDTKDSLINKLYINIFNNIEHFFNNPEHARLILHLSIVSLEKVGQELLYICLALSKELDESIIGGKEA